MLLRGTTVLSTLKTLAPPFDAETERELIATAFADDDAKARAAALKLVLAHVKGGEKLKTTLGTSFAKLEEEDAAKRLRAIDRKDRAQLAAALVARGASGRGVAFEEDPDYARALLPKMLSKKDGGTLNITQDLSSKSFAFLDLTTIPDVVFDEIPKLRKKLAFTHLMIWGAPMTTLPKRFVELAPFLKRLTLGYVDFKRLPDEVCACENLESLAIHAFKLEGLNPRLSRLNKLTRLELSESKVMGTLPREVCELTNLQYLRLGFMKTKLPKEMGNLAALQELDLQSSGQIRSLPAELARCTKLKKVNVRWSGVKPEAVKAILPKAKVES